MFCCSKCDSQYSKWTGRCTECGAWGTVKEEVLGPPVSVRKKAMQSMPATELTSLDSTLTTAVQTSTKISEVDRVLGGGIVPGSVVLIAGEPGIGKSTLVAQIAGSFGSDKIIYASGEESANQLSGRFSRLFGTDRRKSVMYLGATDVGSIIATAEKEKPSLLIIDSVQTLNSAQIESTPGSPNLVRTATAMLVELAKRTDLPIILVGQVTKDGSVAGPKTLEHLVDVVLNLEGDPVHATRLLRASKNRFGSADEVGVFEMKESGLVMVENPSAQFLAERTQSPGSVITATVEGSRVFLVEVQALVDKSFYGTPVRRASGFDTNRLQMLSAILSKRAGLKLGESDVFVNVIGGLSLNEPAADLAVATAIVSAVKNEPTEEGLVVFGEVGLGGEVRSVSFIERRLNEITRLGMTSAWVPARAAKIKTDLKLRPVKSVAEL
ncbi:MAG: DNA repair protein RadA [Candidatus Uhrbacteria bacterium]